jgi:hypothetical protein
VVPRRVEVPVESGRGFSRDGKKSQEGPQYGDDLLHGDSPYAGTSFGHKALQIRDPDLWQTVQVVVISKEAQKVARKPRVPPDGRSGESAYPFEMFAIGVN